MHILKAPTVPLLAHVISGGGGGHFTLCCYLSGKIIGFMNSPLPNFETSSYFHLTRSVYYFLKKLWVIHIFFVEEFFSDQFIHWQTTLITEILRWLSIFCRSKKIVHAVLFLFYSTTEGKGMCCRQIETVILGFIYAKSLGRKQANNTKLLV